MHENFAMVHSLLSITHPCVIPTCKYCAWSLLGRSRAGPSLCLGPKVPFLRADSRPGPWDRTELSWVNAGAWTAMRAGVLHQQELRCQERWGTALRLGSVRNWCACCRLGVDSSNTSPAWRSQPLHLTGVRSVHGWIAFSDYQLFFMFSDFM